uniref:Uncharacterized protein n=1 Tax=Bacteriophage sp. TaxID=38018 RepID=A0A8D9PEI4_9VIRU|nr:MAG TPA: hypothetical protein [Bacteriophage sp.]
MFSVFLLYLLFLFNLIIIIITFQPEFNLAFQRLNYTQTVLKS